MRGMETEGCVFFERGLEKKKTQAIKKTQGKREGCSLWGQKRNKLNKKGNKLSKKDQVKRTK